MAGLHYDDGKPRLELIDTYALRQLGEVLAYGAKKYSTDNWREGISYRKLVGSALRHLTAFNDGIDLDEESGLPHLAHAMCCCMMLLGTTKLHPEMDDRWKEAKEAPPIPRAHVSREEMLEALKRASGISDKGEILNG